MNRKMRFLPRSNKKIILTRSNMRNVAGTELVAWKIGDDRSGPPAGLLDTFDDTTHKYQIDQFDIIDQPTTHPTTQHTTHIITIIDA